ncbi:MAG: phycobilisome protein [Synechococcales bacterium]|nr:phycobilisome protein [Synechococcales bacterium]
MLSQMQRLSVEADGRFATDDELRFLANYVKSYELRVQTYQRLQELEDTILQQMYDRLKANDPNFFRKNNVDMTAKCRRDISYTLRYCAACLLIDDPDALQEHVLLWQQTIVRAFGKQRSNQQIHTVLQELVKRHLPPQQAGLLLPHLDTCCRILGGI